MSIARKIMSVELNWQPILGGLLVAGGAAWAAFQAWRARPVRPISWPANEAMPTVAPDAPPQRSADESAPPGAQEWVRDITAAMGDASAESKLTALRDGLTRDQARMARITELEAKTA